MLKALQPVLRTMEHIAPQLNANIAFRYMSRPGVRPMRDIEREIQSQAITGKRSFRHFTLQTYKWGNGPKKALLVHGWEGRAANFGAIVPILVEHGYTIHSFDAPCHGESTRGKVSVFDYGQVVREYLQEETYDLLVSHSFGSVALIYALYHLQPYPIHDAIILTSPDRFIDRIDQAIGWLGLTDITKQALVEKLRKDTGEEPEDLNLSEFVPSIPINRGLFIHDVADKIIPLEWSKRIQQNWAGTEFATIEGTGHFRMLWSEEVKELISNFLSVHEPKP